MSANTGNDDLANHVSRLARELSELSHTLRHGSEAERAVRAFGTWAKSHFTDLEAAIRFHLARDVELHTAARGRKETPANKDEATHKYAEYCTNLSDTEIGYLGEDREYGLTYLARLHELLGADLWPSRRPSGLSVMEEILWETIEVPERLKWPATGRRASFLVSKLCEWGNFTRKA